jgi:hypothetical protein
LKELIKRLGYFIYYQKVYIFEWNLKNNRKMFEAKIPLVTSHASIDEVMQLHCQDEMDVKVYPQKFLKVKMETGAWKCIVAKYSGKIVGYAFYSTKEMSFSGSKNLKFKLPENCVYIFRNFVHLSFRNLSIHKKIEDTWLKIFQNNGIKYAYAAVNSTNEISINNFKKTGGEIIGSVYFFKTSIFNKAFLSSSINKRNLKIVI